ncbi:Sla2p [Rhodotorula paludigena]|uniref:Sla2p n=1 Tax=Rhodotorula paludigena TaxID=86838 RepID=UPI00316D4BF9
MRAEADLQTPPEDLHTSGLGPRMFSRSRSNTTRSATSDYIDREDYADRDRPQQQHNPTRPVDKDKAETELQNALKKATNPDETAPKQKHVRKAIVFTWDYRSSASIWSTLRVLPILSDEVQTFKALITVHKILQEGHSITLKEAQNQTSWLETCARTVGGDATRGYGALIRAYVKLILAKLKFHKHHTAFNGLFEYEEYIALRGIDDPNEGFETIMDLMNLQDDIDSFQKLIFAHFRGSANNECRISALVPQVKESYGIYRFIISMLRAMYRRTDSMDALEPLKDRYDHQHFALRKFYYECSNLKYLTGLINVPKLPQEPPSLVDSGDTPDLPRRPPPSAAPTPPPAPPSAGIDIDEQRRALEEYERKQAALVAQRETEAQRVRDEQARQEREFAEQQRLQQQREREAQEALERQLREQQMMGVSQGRIAELEREILGLRGQWERDQMMLERYDARVKALEGELANVSQTIQQQLSSKDQMLQQLQEQVTLWRNKYEALAKLYSQLRNEHLEMLAKYKQMQLKANSAQEAIDKMERMERDVKAKNLELADMIRERDRARFELDRIKSSQKEEVERLKRDLRFAEERFEDASRSKGSEVSTIMGKFGRQVEELESSLRTKQERIDELLAKLDNQRGEADRVRDEKDQEIAIMQEGMDDTIRQLSELQLSQGMNDEAVNAQIDNLVLDQAQKFNDIIDSILQACAHKVDDAMYEIESPMHDGNQNSTPEYTLSMIEKATTSATEFAMVFSLYLSRDKGGEIVEVIKSANTFAQDIAEVLTNTKGLSRLAPDDAAIDALVKTGKVPGDAALKFFNAVQSYRLQGSQPDTRKEIVVRNNMEVRSALSKLATMVEGLKPKAGAGSLAKANGDLGDLVESEMQAAARAIEAATERLQAIMARPKDSRLGSTDLQVHDAILASALAITNAIGRLIKAATDSQQEIVAQGKGSSTSTAFYKRNHRWTEGLISAAKAVARATTFLIETADGVITGHKTLEQLIVASNEVASATAQLVQASRVKSELMSRTQEQLELAAKAVTDACRALVRQVKAITEQQLKAEDDFDPDSLDAHQFKLREMECQVEIVTLEKNLADARRRLGVFRRSNYHKEDE